MDLVEASAVYKRYGGVVALAGAEFRARAGEVHALIGENGAGKSTFIQILAGVIRPSTGTLKLRGEPFAPANTWAAQCAGVSAVFQELSLVPDLTVAQNVWFRREPLSAFGTARQARLQSDTTDLVKRYEIPLAGTDRELRRLNLAERQIVEIAKALARSPSVLILDEATSALAPRETAWLLGLAKRLAGEGMLVIYISHRLAEVRKIADRITVFRGGATVARYAITDVDDDQVIADMLGRRMERLYPERRQTVTAEVALRVRDLGVGTRLSGVDLDLHAGEVVGVAGLQGHGQRELFQSLYGITRAHGSIELWGKPTVIRSPRQALRGRNGLALVPEDRRTHGLLLSKTVRENLTLAVVPRFARFGLLSARLEKNLVADMLRSLQIKTITPEQAAGTLSGGNQQKVIFGKMLLTRSRILLLYDPTRGIDVGTKGEIFRLMRDLAAQGYAILFYSSDLQEIVNVADRVVVLRNGRLAAVLDGGAMSEHRILYEAMAGSAFHELVGE
jgi:ribose transport system ATP-binding protein